MIYKRIIFKLQDGRKKYCTRNGSFELWAESEVQALSANHARGVKGVYTADFTKFDFSTALIRSRYPYCKVVRIVDFEVEDHNLPINPDIIF
ncbi:MAG: hypothetical protein SNJ29_11700 [Rikenellaceae bacterium]